MTPKSTELGLLAGAIAVWETDKSFDRAAVAALTPSQIQRMTNEELVQAIHASDLLRVRPEFGRHTAGHDRRTLERTVYIARRCSRNLEGWGPVAEKFS